MNAIWKSVHLTLIFAFQLCINLMCPFKTPFICLSTVEVSFMYYSNLLPPANEVCEGYVFTPVCHSVHRGVSASVHAGIPHPPGSRPSMARQSPLARQTHPGKADPPCAVHAGRYGQQAGGMHPTGMQSCFCLPSVQKIVWKWLETHMKGSPPCTLLR